MLLLRRLWTKTAISVPKPNEIYYGVREGFIDHHLDFQELPQHALNPAILRCCKELLVKITADIESFIKAKVGIDGPAGGL